MRSRALLTRLGAHESMIDWEERRMRREVRATANRLANFDDANLRRSARAAVAAGARVQRALEILGGDAPEHLLQAGRLRLEHKQASLEELGALSDPVMTKDAVAGRIRRLLAMADKRAAELGVPDTESAVTPDMLGALTARRGASRAGPSLRRLRPCRVVHAQADERHRRAGRRAGAAESVEPGSPQRSSLQTGPSSAATARDGRRCAASPARRAEAEASPDALDLSDARRRSSSTPACRMSPGPPRALHPPN